MHYYINFVICADGMEMHGFVCSQLSCLLRSAHHNFGTSQLTEIIKERKDTTESITRDD